MAGEGMMIRGELEAASGEAVNARRADLMTVAGGASLVRLWQPAGIKVAQE